MKIAVIEDEKSHRDLLVSWLESWGGKKGKSLAIRPFGSAESFLFAYEEEKDFDLLFLDIQMEGMDGMELARKIREKDRDIVIVFTTGISDYLEEGYEVEALYYLIKPLSAEKVEKCMEKAAARRRQERFVTLHTAAETLKIGEESINYVEARGRGCCIGRAREPGELEVRESLGELEQMLEAGEFMKCHRSYLCRIGNIHHIGKEEIFFDDGSSVPVSRRLYQQVNRNFIAYFKGKFNGKIPCSR